MKDVITYFGELKDLKYFTINVADLSFGRKNSRKKLENELAPLLNSKMGHVKIALILLKNFKITKRLNVKAFSKRFLSYKDKSLRGKTCVSESEDSDNGSDDRDSFIYHNSDDDESRDSNDSDDSDFTCGLGYIPGVYTPWEYAEIAAQIDDDYYF